MAVGVSRARAFFGVSCTMNVLLFGLPFARFYVLRHRTRNWMSLASDFFFGLASIIVIISGSFSIQTYADELRDRNRPEITNETALELIFVTDKFLKIEFARSILYLCMLWCMKVSFLLLYCNLYARMSTKKHAAFWFTAAFLPISFAVVMALYFTSCKPLSGNWDLIQILVTGHFCSPSFDKRTQIVSTVLNVATDVMLMTLPLLILRALKLSKLEARVLPFVFLLGIISISATLIRFIVLDTQGAYEISAGAGRVTTDNLHWVDVLSTLEILAAFLAFCLPAFRFLLAQSMRERKTPRPGYSSTGATGPSFGYSSQGSRARREEWGMQLETLPSGDGSQIDLRSEGALAHMDGRDSESGIVEVDRRSKELGLPSWIVAAA